MRERLILFISIKNTLSNALPLIRPLEIGKNLLHNTGRGENINMDFDLSTDERKLARFFKNPQIFNFKSLFEKAYTRELKISMYRYKLYSLVVVPV